MEGLGEGIGQALFRRRKSKGRSRKPLAEVYLRERPVARHFVYRYL